MMYYTHLAFGLLTALLAIDFFNIKNKLVFVLIAVFFSIFPDIDETKSKIGKKYKWTSKIINFIFGHRGFLHAVYIPLVLFFIFYGINEELGIAVLAGYFSHLFMDALTKKGIKPFYPLLNKRTNGFFKTGSLLEKMFFLVMVVVDLSLILTYI